LLAIAVFSGIPAGQAPEATLPTDPGMYLATSQGFQKILGQPFTFERTGSRLVSGLTLGIKAAHNNIQIPGPHAQTMTGPEPSFVLVPSQREMENGLTAGDLVLLSLEVHGERRQIEVGAGGAWRASGGVSITHQLGAVRTELSAGTYQLRPDHALKPGEYALYLQRGEGLPPILYDFSVAAESNEPAAPQVAAPDKKAEVPRDKSGTLSITSEPAGAEIYVKDFFRGVTPLIMKLEPGTYYVRAFKKGWRNWMQPVKVGEGEEAYLAVTMVKAE
jgi:hypothetical protein